MQRLTFLELLEKEFADETKATLFRESSRKRIQENLSDRAFDDFSVLIDERLLEATKDEYLKLLNTVQIRLNPIIEEKNGDVSEKDLMLVDTEQQAFIQWKNKLISVGIEDLLEKPFNIKKSLIDLLEWNDLKLNTFSILGGFVAAIHQLFTDAIADTVANSPFAYLAICEFESKKAPDLLICALKEKGFDPDMRALKEKEVDLDIKIIDEFEILNAGTDEATPSMSNSLPSSMSNSFLNFFKNYSPQMPRFYNSQNKFTV